MRVQIPAYTDRWMMGDRYGEVTGITRTRKRPSPDARPSGGWYEIAKVKLDKSGKTVKVILDDCTVV